MLYKRIKSLIQKSVSGIFDFLNPLKVTLFIGSEGSLLCAYQKNKLIDSRYICNNINEYSSLESLKDFITKYKKARIYIFLDNPEAFIKHVDLTSLESLIPRDIIKNFANKEFKQDALYSYKVLSLEMASAERIQAIFAVTPMNEVISFWLKSVFEDQNFKFGNIYFLPLEAQNIIYSFIKNYTEEEKHKELLKADIQIFIFITKASGIRIITEQNRNILLNTKIKYPIDKSLDYLHGTIEHELNETLLSLKHLVEYDEEVIINLTVVAEERIANLLRELKFNTDSQIIIDLEKINYNKFARIIPQELMTSFDVILSDIILYNKLYPATNTSLKKLLNLRAFNRFCSKPLILALMILAIGNIFLKLTINKNEANIASLSRSYFKALLEYRKLKGYFSNIEHLDQSIEILLLQERLEMPKAKPFELLHEFILLQNERVQIEHIKWYKNHLTPNIAFTAEIELKYSIKNISRDEFTYELTNYIKELKKQFRPYNIDYMRNEGKAKVKSDKISIPIKILISG
ncbi:MAG: hypothetical protein K0R02_349 [Rickettsiaceae bacterium]|jgi:hypothetical protein|nr:hypothetical protein [Rickettsiaceae bacterium]